MEQKARELEIRQNTMLTSQANHAVFTHARIKRQQESHPHMKRRTEAAEGAQYKTVKMPHIIADEYDPDATQKLKRLQQREVLDEQVGLKRKKE